VDALGAAATAVGYLLISTLAGVISYIRAVERRIVDGGFAGHIGYLARKGAMAAFVGLLVWLAMRWVGYADSPLGYLIAGIVCVYSREALDLAWWALKSKAESVGVPIRKRNRADMRDDQGDRKP
jgi:hypothetical protein